jgi:hypothetical protein
MDHKESPNDGSDVNDPAAFATPLRVPGSDGMLHSWTRQVQDPSR